MNYELKNMINQMYELSDTLDEGPLGLAQTTSTTLKNCIQVELLSYLMYLSAADGKIAWQDNLTTDEIHQFIVEEQIYSTEFEEKVPLSM